MSGAMSGAMSGPLAVPSCTVDELHRTSDEQSLRLTQAALQRLIARPELLEQARATLDHWDRVAPPASKPLRDEWRRILDSSDWKAALDSGNRGQQLRQASPLGRALDARTRWSIIRQCKGRSSSLDPVDQDLAARVGHWIRRLG